MIFQTILVLNSLPTEAVVEEVLITTDSTEYTIDTTTLYTIDTTDTTA